PEADVLERTQPDEYSEAMSGEAAAELAQMMQATVEYGTADSVGLPEGSGAKTGTAQRTPDKNPYAWFVAFSPNRDVAVAVIVESEEGFDRELVAGSTLAGPIA